MSLLHPEPLTKKILFDSNADYLKFCVIDEENQSL